MQIISIKSLVLKSVAEMDLFILTGDRTHFEKGKEFLNAAKSMINSGYQLDKTIRDFDGEHLSSIG